MPTNTNPAAALFRGTKDIHEMVSRFVDAANAAASSASSVKVDTSSAEATAATIAELRRVADALANPPKNAPTPDALRDIARDVMVPMADALETAAETGVKVPGTAYVTAAEATAIRDAAKRLKVRRSGGASRGPRPLEGAPTSGHLVITHKDKVIRLSFSQDDPWKNMGFRLGKVLSDAGVDKPKRDAARAKAQTWVTDSKARVKPLTVHGVRLEVTTD